MSSLMQCFGFKKKEKKFIPCYLNKTPEKQSKKCSGKLMWRKTPHIFQHNTCHGVPYYKSCYVMNCNSNVKGVRREGF